MPVLISLVILALIAGGALAPALAEMTARSFPVPEGSGPHDVWPAADGGVWYTAQAAGKLGHLDPATGEVKEIALGKDSAPHGVILGPDGAPWITDGGRNALLRVDPETAAVTSFPLPRNRGNANLNTASFDRQGLLWFTGQSGVYGRLDPATGALALFDAPHGAGPYGITTTPEGEIFYVSLAGSYLARLDRASGAAAVIEPPVARQGARRVWSDSRGALWITGWNSGHLFRYEPAAKAWRSWRVPGRGPQPYAVYVDEEDAVWISDWGANALWRFDPGAERFAQFPLPDRSAGVRQLAGRKGEVWGAESAVDKLVRFREE